MRVAARDGRHTLYVGRLRAVKHDQKQPDGALPRYLRLFLSTKAIISTRHTPIESYFIGY